MARREHSAGRPANAAAGRTVMRCDARGLAADLATIDALARLQLVAHRCGVHVTLDGASPELRRLIELSGLGRVLQR